MNPRDTPGDPTYHSNTPRDHPGGALSGTPQQPHDAPNSPPSIPTSILPKATLDPPIDPLNTAFYLGCERRTHCHH